MKKALLVKGSTILKELNDEIYECDLIACSPRHTAIGASIGEFVSRVSSSNLAQLISTLGLHRMLKFPSYRHIRINIVQISDSAARLTAHHPVRALPGRRATFAAVYNPF